MFDFPHVIEDGTTDEIKDCLIATMSALPPTANVTMHLVRSDVFAHQQRLAANWAEEWDQALRVVYSRNAERTLAKTISAMMTREMTVDEARLHRLRFELEGGPLSPQVRQRVRRMFFGRRRRAR